MEMGLAPCGQLRLLYVFITKYILILFVTILIDYWAAIGIETSRNPMRRKFYLVSSVLSTCLVLAAFNYFNFINQNIIDLPQFIGLRYPVPILNVILPIGLSFHTFQSLSYVIEVYRRNQLAERHFGIYSLYVMFYPQLVAGPIERPQNLLHQLRERHYFNPALAVSGLRLIAFGLGKKLLIADRLSPTVDAVYSAPSHWHGLSMIAATVLFAIQIYCDFSGYSDIARGTARTMGFELMRNFRAPYLSSSVQEFWRRWHISLSTWFKDYLYVPLGGSRVSKPRWAANIMTTFTASGLWHGANWTYIIWGALNGAYLIVEASLPRRVSAGNSAVAGWSSSGLQGLRILQTFAIICVAWVFFRAQTLAEAWTILGGCTWNLRFDSVSFRELDTLFITGKRIDSFVSLMGIAALFGFDILHERYGLPRLLNRLPTIVRYGLYLLFGLVLCLKGNFVSANFIYFQF